MHIFKTLAKCIREYKRPMLVTIVLIVLEAVIETFIPFITANLVNLMKAGASLEEILKNGILLIGLAAISLTCGAIAAQACSKSSSGFAKNVRHDAFHRIQSFTFERIDAYSSASLVTRLTTDVQNVQMSYMMLIRTALRSPLMLIFSVVMAYVMGGALSAIFVVVIPVLGVGLYFIARRAMPRFRAVFKKYDKLNESIEENVRGMRVVKGFSRQEYEKQKFTLASEDIRDDFYHAERIVALNTPLMQFCLYFNMIFVLFIGSKLAIESKGVLINVGQISAMLTYGMQILMSLMMLSSIFVILTISSQSAKRLVEILEDDAKLPVKEDAETEVADGSIVFEGVSFKYSEKAKKYALENINLEIASGMTVGIIGGTGSSKSTLVSLIPRLYDVTEGSILIGGRDVRDYDLDSLRTAVSMVLQKNLLFRGTIRENLKWGNPNATDEEIIEAAKLAQAHDFITSFPDGYDTMIEQGGTNVSGGQKQRLCIARALLRRPKILILDDSTSAVDTKTDALIRRGFEEFIPSTTKIIIAQRIASVEKADLILVLDGGKLIAKGTHEQLLSTCSIYHEIYLEQTKGGESDESANET